MTWASELEFQAVVQEQYPPFTSEHLPSPNPHLRRVDTHRSKEEEAGTQVHPRTGGWLRLECGLAPVSYRLFSYFSPPGCSGLPGIYFFETAELGPTTGPLHFHPSAWKVLPSDLRGLFILFSRALSKRAAFTLRHLALHHLVFLLHGMPCVYCYSL